MFEIRQRLLWEAALYVRDAITSDIKAWQVNTDIRRVGAIRVIHYLFLSHWCKLVSFKTLQFSTLQVVSSACLALKLWSELSFNCLSQEQVQVGSVTSLSYSAGFGQKIQPKPYFHLLLAALQVINKTCCILFVLFIHDSRNVIKSICDFRLSYILFVVLIWCIMLNKDSSSHWEIK